jgi:hypothetical protein
MVKKNMREEPLTLVVHVWIASDCKSTFHATENLEAVRLPLLDKPVFNLLKCLFGECAVGFSAGKEHWD